MKVLAVLLGFGVVGAVAYFLLRPASPSVKFPAAQTAPGFESGPARSAAPPTLDKPIQAPLSQEEEVREAMGRKRIPYYKFLRDNYSELVRHFAVTDNLDTLDLEVARADNGTLQTILSNAVAPYARQYGFRKVRFYTANPPRSVQPVTLVAESADDGSGHWNTFLK